MMENKKTQEKPESLEQAFGMIEEVIEKLENPEINLEDSFNEYSKGVELLKYCNSTIDMVEKKVMKLNEAGDLEEFE